MSVCSMPGNPNRPLGVCLSSSRILSITAVCDSPPADGDSGAPCRPPLPFQPHWAHYSLWGSWQEQAWACRGVSSCVGWGLWGRLQLGLLLLRRDPTRSPGPQAKEGSSILCADPSPDANVKPWDLAAAHGRPLTVASVHARPGQAGGGRVKRST